MIGTRFGAYEITGKLGAGGMGEVYRATDTKLDRAVAIKVLPAAFTADAERLARFEREAKLLASLNHSNIAHVYGFESATLDDAAGVHFLAMELVEGEDLADRLKRGPIPIDEALAIARQTAEALEEAHEHGIVHRDLKPANVKVTPDGKVKVLDFGLAKAYAAESATASDADVSHSPTLARTGTQAGVLLGTAAYMSPEQARGKTIDKRADIWSFGVVLFEMLTGKRLFQGETASDVLAAVLTRAPDLTALPAGTPGPVRQLLRRCLERDPRRRLRDVGDARLDLDEAAGHAAADATGAPAVVTRRSPVTFVAIAALAAMAAVATWGWVRAGGRQAPLRPPGTYVVAALGVSTPMLPALCDRFAVAPVGGALVLVDPDNGGLLLRRPSDLNANPIRGARPRAFSPVFSPDGRWVAFSSPGEGLMKIPVEGGAPVLIAPRSEGVLDTFINPTWGPDDRIRFQSLDSLRSVPATGGPVETLALGRKARVHRAQWLPGGRLLVSMTAGGEKRIAVREADGTLRPLTAGWDGRLTPTGHLLYSRAEGTAWSLVAAPFDPRTATLSGDATVIAPDVAVYFATPAAATTSGDLFYLGRAPRSDRRVVLVDRAGTERGTALAPGAWVDLRLSADGHKLALNRWEGARRTIWTLALGTGALTQVTYAEDTLFPRWMPDGKRVLFTHFPLDPDQSSTSMWSVLADGRGNIEPILPGKRGEFPEATSADGRTLYYTTEIPGRDILTLELGITGSKPTPLVATPASESQPVPSPDGRWLAYATNASGTDEVQVAALHDVAIVVQVSTRGGEPVRWSPDGTRLFYRDGDTIAVVDVARAGPVLSSRRTAFPVPHDQVGGVDVMPDGEHAVMIRGGRMYSDLVIVQGALAPR